jgi:hypothetical protein
MEKQINLTEKERKRQIGMGFFFAHGDLVKDGKQEKKGWTNMDWCCTAACT